MPLRLTFSLFDKSSRIRSAAASVSCIGAFLSLGAALAAAASSFRLGCTIHSEGACDFHNCPISSVV